MTPYEAVNEIAKMLTDVIAVPVKLPNREFTQDNAPIFAELTFQHTGTGQTALTGLDQGSHTSSGVCLVDLFFFVGIGVEEPYTTTETVARIYRGKRSTSGLIWFRNVSHREVERPRYPGRYQMMVSFEFQYDH